MLKRAYPAVPVVVTSEELNTQAAYYAFRSARIRDFIVLPDEAAELTTMVQSIERLPMSGNRRDNILPVTKPNQAVRLSKNAIRCGENAAFYVSQHYSEKIYVREVARYCGMGEDAFSRLFKTEQGYSFRHFLTRYRLDIAKKLLQETDSPISQIAYHTGFENVPLFNKLFKSLTGKAPSVYRQACRSEAVSTVKNGKVEKIKGKMQTF